MAFPTVMKLLISRRYKTFVKDEVINNLLNDD